MYIKKETKEVFSSKQQIRQLYPNVSIGEKSDLSSFGIFLVEKTNPPEITSNQYLIKGEPEEYELNKFRETWIISENKTFDEYIPESVTPLQGLLILDQLGLSDQYTQWSNDPARTFIEKAFIEKAQSWRFDNPVLDSAIKVFGLTEEDKINFFKLAASLNV